MTAPRKTGKTGSRNPANKATTVTAWKKTSFAPPIELPSGNFMRIKKIGLATLMKTGLMPNSLMSFATQAVGKGTGKPQELTTDEMAELAANPDKVNDIAEFMDRVAIFVAQEPEVDPVPDVGVERDDARLYVDELSDDDKLFIFQVVTGGTTDLETFRLQHSASMAAIRGREDLELPSE